MHTFEVLDIAAASFWVLPLREFAPGIVTQKLIECLWPPEWFEIAPGGENPDLRSSDRSLTVLLAQHQKL